eukprot:CFRG1709T1
MSQITRNLRSLLREINAQHTASAAAPLRRYIVDLHREYASADSETAKAVAVDAFDYIGLMKNHREFLRLFELYYPNEDHVSNRKIVGSAANRVGLQAPIEYNPENPDANSPQKYNRKRKGMDELEMTADKEKGAFMDPN